MEIYKPKNINLQAYTIEHTDLKSASSDLFCKLKERWSTSTSANDRRLTLSSTSSEEDVLAGLVVASNYIIGTIMRIAPTKEVPTIPDKLFEDKTIQLSPHTDDMVNSSVTVLHTYYFLVCNDFVISTLPHSQIKRLQAYLNWWLTSGDDEKSYKFFPMIKVPDGIKLSEMKELALGEHYVVPKTDGSSSGSRYSIQTGVKIIDVAAEFLRQKVTDVPNLDELINKNILNARLVISFTKPRKMTIEDYKSTLSSYLKPIADAEDLSIKLKQGKTIKGKDILCNKTVSIERLDAVRISEPDLFEELKDFMRDITK